LYHQEGPTQGDKDYSLRTGDLPIMTPGTNPGTASPLPLAHQRYLEPAVPHNSSLLLGGCHAQAQNPPALAARRKNTARPRFAPCGRQSPRPPPSASLNRQTVPRLSTQGDCQPRPQEWTTDPTPDAGVPTTTEPLAALVALTNPARAQHVRPETPRGT